MSDDHDSAAASIGRLAGLDDSGPHFCGGPKRNVRAMIEATASLRDLGGLPAPAALVLSQLLLNLAGHAGRGRALQLVDLLLDAADAPGGFRQ